MTIHSVPQPRLFSSIQIHGSLPRSTPLGSHAPAYYTKGRSLVTAYGAAHDTSQRSLQPLPSRTTTHAPPSPVYTIVDLSSTSSCSTHTSVSGLCTCRSHLDNIAHDILTVVSGRHTCSCGFLTPQQLLPAITSRSCTSNLGSAHHVSVLRSYILTNHTR